jgi:protein gp37
MGDFFDSEVPPDWRERAWNVIRACDELDWQILTKRPENIMSMLPPDWENGWDHVWMGTTVEDQTRADERVPILLEVPAKIRFLSCEPLLGPVIIPRIGELDWIIVGGESGPGYRPMHPDWARSLRDQCMTAGVAFHFKQWGTDRPKLAGRHLDNRTWDGFPITQTLQNAFGF